MNAYIDSFSVLSQRKAKELKISDCKHAYRSALLPIHRRFLRLLKIFCAGLQKSFGCPPAFRQQDDIVCITDARHPSFLKLLVEFVEVDIRQQGR